MVCRDGEVFLCWRAVGRIWVPSWVVISAVVITCKYIQQLLSVWRSIDGRLA